LEGGRSGEREAWTGRGLRPGSAAAPPIGSSSRRAARARPLSSNPRGDLPAYDALCAKYAKVLNGQPALVENERKLREKVWGGALEGLSDMGAQRRDAQLAGGTPLPSMQAAARQARCKPLPGLGPIPAALPAQNLVASLPRPSPRPQVTISCLINLISDLPPEQRTIPLTAIAERTKLSIGGGPPGPPWRAPARPRARAALPTTRHRRPLVKPPPPPPHPTPHPL
jgi:hypothetical protein